MTKQKIKKIKHYKYDKEQRDIYEENHRATCWPFIEQALKQQREEIKEMIEGWKTGNCQQCNGKISNWNCKQHAYVDIMSFLKAIDNLD